MKETVLPEGPSIFAASHSQILMSMGRESLALWVWKLSFSTARYTNYWPQHSPGGEAEALREKRFLQDGEGVSKTGSIFIFPSLPTWASAPQGLVFPRSPLPRRWFSTAEAWRVCTLTGRGGEATNSWTFNQQLLLWEMRGRSHPPSGRDPGGRWVLRGVPVVSCWHRGSR